MLSLYNHWGSPPCLPLLHKPFPLSLHLPALLQTTSDPSPLLAPVSLQLSNPRIPGWGWERRRLEYHACSSLPFQFPLPPPSPGTAAASRDIWVNYCCFISCPWNQTESHPKIHNRTVLYTPCIKWITFCLFLQISPLWLHLKSQSVHEVPSTSSLQVRTVIHDG